MHFLSKTATRLSHVRSKLSSNAKICEITTVSRTGLICRSVPSFTAQSYFLGSSVQPWLRSSTSTRNYTSIHMDTTRWSVSCSRYSSRLLWHARKPAISDYLNYSSGPCSGAQCFTILKVGTELMGYTSRPKSLMAHRHSLCLSPGTQCSSSTSRSAFPLQSSYGDPLKYLVHGLESKSLPDS